MITGLTQAGLAPHCLANRTHNTANRVACLTWHSFLLHRCNGKPHSFVFDTVTGLLWSKSGSSL